MLFLGFGIGTKVTFAIAAVYPLIEFLLKKNYRKIFISIGVIFLVYLVTNPFTFLYSNEFIQRILEMRVKENGIVIDSYNTSYFKYLFSLFNLISIPVTIFSLFYIIKKVYRKEIDITIFISIFYILFFSFSSLIFRVHVSNSIITSKPSFAIPWSISLFKISISTCLLCQSLSKPFMISSKISN